MAKLKLSIPFVLASNFLRVKDALGAKQSCAVDQLPAEDRIVGLILQVHDQIADIIQAVQRTMGKIQGLCVGVIVEIAPSVAHLGQAEGVRPYHRDAANRCGAVNSRYHF